MEGTPFGRYQLLGLLGRGGMGEVWRAHDTVTERVVAIKMLPPQYSGDPTFQQRFRREALAAARLNSPHVIPIYEHGEIDGRLFVSMRLVEGRDLHHAITEGPLPPARAVRIIEQIAKALHAAHQVGLVHRDVKPSNVLLDRDDFAYLIDFGIARATDDTRMTGTGYAVGTFQYIAPERLGERSDDDARADVYALACVLYECLTGRTPFAATSMAGLVAAHLNSPPPKPSTTNPELPQQLDRVIATGMAKDPDLRYQTTLELAAAANAAITPQDAISPQPAPLQPVTEVAPVHAPPTAPSAVTHQRPPHDAAPQVHQSLDALYPTSSTPRRRRPALIAAALAVVGIVVITVATLRMTGEEPVAESPPAPIGTTLPFTGLVTAEGVAVGADNSVYAASYDGNQVLKLAAGASTPTVLPFPGLFAPTGVAVGTDNSVYVADTGNQRVLKLAPDSTTPIELPFPDFHAPRGVAVGADNTVYVANREYYTTGQGQHWVQKLAPGATAPVDLPFTDLYGPYGVAVGTDNAVYVTDAFSTERNRVMKLDPGASTPVELPFTGLDNPSGVAVGADNTVYVTSQGDHGVLKLAPGATTSVAVPVTGLNAPTGIAVVGDDLYVTDKNNRVVRVATGAAP